MGNDLTGSLPYPGAQGSCHMVPTPPPFRVASPGSSRVTPQADPCPSGWHVLYENGGGVHWMTGLSSWPSRWLDNRNLLFHVSGGLSPQTNILAELGPSGGSEGGCPSLPASGGCQQPSGFPGPQCHLHITFSCSFPVSLCPKYPSPFSYQETSHWL